RIHEVASRLGLQVLVAAVQVVRGREVELAYCSAEGLLRGGHAENIRLRRSGDSRALHVTCRAASSLLAAEFASARFAELYAREVQRRFAGHENGGPHRHTRRHRGDESRTRQWGGRRLWNARHD